MHSSPYTDEYFARHLEGSKRSAKIIVPIVMDAVKPRSVVDVGCGLGTWLQVFRDHGVSDILGIDGAYVDTEALKIPSECFVAHDLTAFLRLDSQFDLVVSLEVAEHLSKDFASTFVDTLTGLGPVILFSAAIPFQGGENHVNEQWPEYWVQQFEKRGYIAADSIRNHIWQNESVEWWYAQNALLFVRESALPDYPSLATALERRANSLLNIVHPTLYWHRVEERNQLIQSLQAELRTREEDCRRLISGIRAELTTNVSERDEVIGRLREQLATWERCLGDTQLEIQTLRLQLGVAERDQLIHNLQQELQNLRQTTDFQIQIRELNQAIRDIQTQLAERNIHIRELSSELHSIRLSRFWPLVHLSGVIHQFLERIGYFRRFRSY